VLGNSELKLYRMEEPWRVYKKLKMSRARGGIQDCSLILKIKDK